MNLKPLYRSDNILLVGLYEDFEELCVIDGLVVEVDIDKKTVGSEPESGLRKLKEGSFVPIRQDEKKEYCRLIEKKLKRKLIRQIELDLVSPPQESIDSLIWIPERLGGKI